MNNPTEERSMAFWAYKKGKSIFEKNPDDRQWEVNNAINHFDSKGTENDFENMETDAVGWCISSLDGPNTILRYLNLLEKEIETCEDVEKELIKKYIAITVLEFFRAWERIKFSYEVFEFFQNSWKECKLGQNYISPATKLKVLFAKYESFLDEVERVEFDRLISVFKTIAIPMYKNADLAAEKLILISLEKQKAKLEEEIARANEIIDETLPKNYDQIWLKRLDY